MGALPNARAEKFCWLVAIDNVDPAEACYRAGYGAQTTAHSTKRDNYHSIQANRLLDRPEVQARINTLRQRERTREIDYKASLIQTLKDAIALDHTKYFASNTIKMKNDRIITDVYLKKQIQDWDAHDAVLVNGYDRRGLPMFIDKQWAIEKLIDVYQLNGKSGADIEDILSLFTQAGLTGGFSLGEPNTYTPESMAELDRIERLED